MNGNDNTTINSISMKSDSNHVAPIAPIIPNADTNTDMNTSTNSRHGHGNRNRNRTNQEGKIETHASELEAEEEKKEALVASSSLKLGLEKDEIILLAGDTLEVAAASSPLQSPMSSPSSPSFIQKRAARKARSWRPPTPPSASSYDTVTNDAAANASSRSGSPVFAPIATSGSGSEGTSTSSRIPSQRFFPFNLFSSNTNANSMMPDESLLLTTTNDNDNTNTNTNNRGSNHELNHDDPITNNHQSKKFKRSFKRRNKFMHAILPNTSTSTSSTRCHRNRNRNININQDQDEFHDNDTYQMMKSHHGNKTTIQPSQPLEPPSHNLPLEQSSFFYNDMDNDMMNMQQQRTLTRQQQQQASNTYSYFQPNTRRTFIEQHALLNASFPSLYAFDPEDSHDHDWNRNDPGYSDDNGNDPNGNDDYRQEDQDFDFSALFAFRSLPIARDRDRDRHERRRNRPIMADIRKSSLSYMREGRMQMRVPGDNVRLVMDDYLEAGILSVELDWGGSGGGGAGVGGGGSGGRKKEIGWGRNKMEREVSNGEGVGRSLSLKLVESIDLDGDGGNECPNARAFQDEHEYEDEEAGNSQFKDMDSSQAQAGEGSVSSVLEPQRIGMHSEEEEEEENYERGGRGMPLSGRKKASSRKGYSPLDHGRNGGDCAEGALEHAGPGHAHLEYARGNTPAHVHAHTHTSAHRNSISRSTSGGPTRLPELRYMMTVDQDLYKRVLKEIPDSRMPCGFYYCCHDSVDGTKSVKISVAIMILFVVFTLLFVGTCIWPTD